jgi:ATP-dependent DNA helicase RecG
VTANEVDAALARGVKDVGAALVALREDQWFDRKGAQIAAKDLAPTLVAFANAEGGTIVVGLHGGKVQGLNAVVRKINDYRQASIDHTSPPVRTSFEEIRCVNDRGEDDRLLLIRVDPSERVHELKNGDCYLRIGDENRKLNFSQRQELEFDKGPSQYDGMVASGVAMKDLDRVLLGQFAEAAGAKAGHVNLLRARSLLKPSGEVTNAGCLLFGKRPQELFPQAHVRILRFFSASRGTGSRLGLDESGDVRIEGPIPASSRRPLPS